MAYFGYVIDGEDKLFFTKEEMLAEFEACVKDCGESWGLTKEEILEMTQFQVVFDTQEELEKFF